MIATFCLIYLMLGFALCLFGVFCDPNFSIKRAINAIAFWPSFVVFVIRSWNDD